MDKTQLIETYLNVQNLQGGFWNFYIDLALTALLSFLLSQIYIRYGNSISNRKSFASNFVILSLTTMFIITVVKSSLALSLGLVGALSIVRFRAAIKEPEELAYLFLSISIGLGFGASQRYISILAFAFIALILVFKGFFSNTNREQNLFLNISSDLSGKVDIEDIIKALKPHSSLIKLKRFDKDHGGVSVILYVKLSGLDKLTKAEDSLRHLDKNIKVSFIEDKGVFN